jgi:glycosyltransferase involved in cell wall biosynthesis/GT2 family glycosyltransferase
MELQAHPPSHGADPGSCPDGLPHRDATVTIASGVVDLKRAAIVVIGRNEGERLQGALGSVTELGIPVLYVDSGSQDGSPEVARSLGIEVHELDLGRPLSAGRARNEGFERVMRLEPAPEWVQFLDGDSELAAGWLERGVRELEGRPDAAVVCGRLREQRPEASVYNRLCQLEWDRPCGEVPECGGIMMVRTAAFRQVGGFDSRVVAGEDPELCLRLRRAGWKIWRIDSEMAVHDAAIFRFSQWWRRAVRAGHAYAQSSALHGGSPDRYRVRECRSIWGWAFWLPAIAILLAWPTHGWSLLALAAYPLQAGRIALKERRRGIRLHHALISGALCVLSKWPQLLGLIRYRRGRRSPTIIEHKAPPRRRRAHTMALVAGAFPILSETFVARDVKALRARGWKVLPVGLHRSDDVVPDDFGTPMRAEFVVYDRRLRLLLAFFRETATSPLRAARTLGRALMDAVFPGETTSASARIKFVFQAVAGIGLAGWLRRRCIEHVHCHFAHAPTTVGMYAAHQLGVPFSFTGHANDLFQRRALLRRKLERARFVACISEWHRELYREVWPGDAGRYPVIRCGVETDSWNLPEEARGGDGPFVLLTVGRLIPKKGIDILIRAAGSRRSRPGRPWQVWVAGDGPERARWMELANECGCDGSVRWLGMVSNRRVRQLMTEADAFILPCRTDEKGDRDGIPVVLMEAMACGLPVVAGDLPSIRELVEDGVTGRLVPPERPDLLAEAIDDLERDPETRRRRAMAGRARVESEFSLDVNSHRLHVALSEEPGP